MKASRKNVPLSVLAELTYRCNLDCYCCYRKHHVKKASRELTALQWGGVFRELAEAGTLYLTLSGGEPLVRKDFFDIVARARKHGFAVSIITNGTLITGKTAAALAAMGIMDAGVSFHAADRGLHDRLAGKTGSFARALRALRTLKAAGVKVMIKHTVSNRNFRQYLGLRKRADDEGCGFECDAFVVPDTRGMVSEYALSSGQFKTFLRDMGGAAPFKRAADALHCDAGRSVAGITPYGDVVPCIQLPLALGSLKKERFAPIWSGRAAATFRRREEGLLAECEKCGDRAFCARCHGVAFLESGDFRGKSASLCRRAEANKIIVSRRIPCGRIPRRSVRESFQLFVDNTRSGGIQ